MPLTPEVLHRELGRLVADIPDLAHAPLTPEINRWLAEAAILVEMVDRYEAISLKVASDSLNTVLRDHNAQRITGIVHRALAKAALDAQPEYRGEYIAAGQTHAAYSSVGKVLESATLDVLFVDAYADHSIMDLVALVPRNIPVRVLADAAPWKKKPSLKPAAERWVHEYKATRPLEIRLAPVDTIHDRFIVVDSKTAWGLGQSSNNLAKKQPTAVIQQPLEVAQPLIAAHENLWAAGTALV